MTITFLKQYAPVLLLTCSCGFIEDRKVLYLRGDTV